LEPADDKEGLFDAEGVDEAVESFLTTANPTCASRREPDIDFVPTGGGGGPVDDFFPEPLDNAQESQAFGVVLEALSETPDPQCWNPLSTFTGDNDQDNLDLLGLSRLKVGDSGDALHPPISAEPKTRDAAAGVEQGVVPTDSHNGSDSFGCLLGDPPTARRFLSRSDSRRNLRNLVTKSTAWNILSSCKRGGKGQQTSPSGTLPMGNGAVAFVFWSCFFLLGKIWQPAPRIRFPAHLFGTDDRNARRNPASEERFTVGCCCFWSGLDSHAAFWSGAMVQTSTPTAM